MNRPLMVSADAMLIDEILRLGAAANVEIEVVSDVESARRPWSRAPLVLVGADSAARVAGMRPERRRDVILVGQGVTDGDWQRAVSLGAEHVAALPDSERWLIDRIADSGDGPPSNGVVIAVMSAGGGAGASTFAATLAGVAAETSDALLVDLDPLAAGIDVLLGIEGVPGTRWSDLADTKGRLSPSTLRQALPTWSGASVLSWGREGPTQVTAEALSSVLDSGERGFDVIVVDVPRAVDDVTEHVLTRAHRTLLVTSASVRGAAAASRLGASLRDRCPSLGVLVRLEARGVASSSVASVLTDEVIGELPYAASVPRRCDAGDGPPLRDSYGRSIRRLMPVLLDRAGARA